MLFDGYKDFRVSISAEARALKKRQGAQTREYDWLNLF